MEVGVKYEEKIRDMRCRIEEETAVINELAAVLEGSAGAGMRTRDRHGQPYAGRSSAQQKASRIRTTTIRLEKLPKKHRT